MSTSFNLIHEPWIPIVDADGIHREIGLREVFLKAHDIRELVDSSPLSLFSMMRLLWVLTHRIVDGPRTRAEWKRIWNAGAFDADAVDRYFDEWSNRFDLFGADHPFFQVADFATLGDGSGSSILRLLPERATANNHTLFDHSLDANEEMLTFSEAARALLVGQTFGLGGGKGPKARWRGRNNYELAYTGHAPCVGSTSVFAQFGNLYRTLVGNLAVVGPSKEFPFTSNELDVPIWERDTIEDPIERVPNGYFDLMTWPSRYVRLLPDTRGGVSRMYIGQGASLSNAVPYGNPYTAFRLTKEGEFKPQYLTTRDAIWRSSGALFAATERDRGTAPFIVRELRDGRLADVVSADSNRLLPLVCLGLVNEKANPLMWRSETIPASAALISGEAVQVLDAILDLVSKVHDALYIAMGALASGVLESEGKSANAADVSKIRSRMLSKLDYWARMESSYNQFMHSLAASEDPFAHEARQEWLRAAKHAARASLKHASNFSQGDIARIAKAVGSANRVLERRLAALVVDSAPQPNAPNGEKENP